MAKLYRDGALPKDTISSSDDPTKLYTEGLMVWGSTNASALRTVQQGNPAVYAATSVGSLLDARGKAMEDGQLIGVTSTTKNAATALAFARFLLNEQNQTAFVSIPTIQNFPSTTASLKADKFTKISGTDAYAEAAKLSAGLAQEAQNAFLYSWNDAVNTVIVQQVQLAMQGNKTPEQALKDAQDQANAIVAKSR
jgi:multiple sugar transport system substrate-binding protein